MSVKNHKLAMMCITSLVIFIIRSIFISRNEFQMKYNMSFNLSATLFFIGISLLIAAGILVLNVSVNYFIVESVVDKLCGINLLEYGFKNTLYYIYLLAYCLTTIVSMFMKSIFPSADFVTMTTSLCNYLIVAYFLYFELKKIGVSRKINVLLTTTIFLGNCLTILYMLVR